MVQSLDGKYRFSDFELDTTERVVRQRGAILPLGAKAFQALEILVRNGGKVVSRAEMIQSLWPDAIVEDSNLTVTISVLRRSLGDTDTGTAFIETVPKRGYRFVPQVRKAGDVKSIQPSFGLMEIVRLTHAGRILDVAISADARLLAYVPIDAGNHSLWLWDRETDEKRQLLKPDPALCWGMRFTRDATGLFYTTTQPNTTVSVLHRISIEGGPEPEQQVVVNIDSPIALSPNGNKIAFIRGFPGQHRDVLVVANVDGTDEQELASRQHPNKFSFSSPSWSPDGELIAVGASRSNKLEFTLLATPVNGAPPFEMCPWVWKDLRAVAWNNEGTDLFFRQPQSALTRFRFGVCPIPIVKLNE